MIERKERDAVALYFKISIDALFTDIRRCVNKDEIKRYRGVGLCRLYWTIIADERDDLDGYKILYSQLSYGL